MSLTVDAVYEQGRLRPIEPIALEEGTEVRLIVIPKTSPANGTAGQNAAAILASIAAIPLASGRPVEAASRDHDRILYGENGAR
jgi:predicted DNA-binding antitoxin AbrB/MazE fold protein